MMPRMDDWIPPTGAEVVKILDKTLEALSPEHFDNLLYHVLAGTPISTLSTHWIDNGVC